MLDSSVDDLRQSYRRIDLVFPSIPAKHDFRIEGIGGGLLFFGMAVLVSSIISGEYTAPVVSFGAVIAQRSRSEVSTCVATVPGSS